MKTTFHISSKPRFFIRKSKCYSSIDEALEKIESKNSGGIKLKIHKGIYNCNINMKSNLSIAGKRWNKKKILINCFIKNENGKCLTIKNVTLVPNKKKGISQIGGSLTFYNVIIKSDPKVHQGGIYQSLNSFINVSMGARFKANNIQMVVNSLPSIVIDGAKTIAILFNATIDGAKLFPIPDSNQDIPPFIGALEVKNNATLLIENSLIENNEGIGIFVNNSSRMHLRNTTIRNTKSAQCSDGYKFWGYNLVITNSSIVELHNFSCNEADGVGIFIDNAYLTAEDGSVKNNTIGIHFGITPLESDYNPGNCVHENVRFVGNVSRISGPIPMVLNSDLSNCKTVPWSLW